MFTTTMYGKYMLEIGFRHVYLVACLATNKMCLTSKMVTISDAGGDLDRRLKLFPMLRSGNCGNSSNMKHRSS